MVGDESCMHVAYASGFCVRTLATNQDVGEQVSRIHSLLVTVVHHENAYSAHNFKVSRR